MARGSMRNRPKTIMNADIAMAEYDVITIMSVNSSALSSIPAPRMNPAPAQYMASMRKFCMELETGNTKAMILETVMLFSTRRPLASPKRSCSNDSALYALIGRMPSRPSRVMRLTPSV